MVIRGFLESQLTKMRFGFVAPSNWAIKAIGKYKIAVVSEFQRGHPGHTVQKGPARGPSFGALRGLIRLRRRGLPGRVEGKNRAKPGFCREI